MTVTEAYPSPYLEAGDLNGKDVSVEIESVEGKHAGKGKDGQPINKPLLKFKGAKKGLILCKTSARVIRDKLGYGNDMDGWIGRKITLFPDKCDAFGQKDVPCIRIRPYPPK